MDFGLAKLAGQVKLTREGTTIGTVAYMSPEQARGEAVDQRTDIWSLGVVLYEMLAGKLPFKGDFEQTLIHSILNSEPEPITKFRKDLPAGLAQIISKTLSKNSAARYQTIDELVEDLNAVAEGLKPLRAKAGLFLGKILGIKKVHAYIGLGIFVVLAALAVLFLFPKHGKIIDSLAVLPFENRSQDPQQEGTADALTEDLISKFHAVKWLRVPMFRTVAGYKKTQKSYREIGQEQNVKAILDGAMLRAGDRVKIWVRLVDASTELALWTHEEERDMKDILALGRDISLAIFSELQIRLSPDEQKRFNAYPKVDTRAYDAYIEAKKINNTLTSDPTFERWKSGIAYLQKAMDIEPSFAPIYWCLMDFWASGQGLSLISYEDSITGAEAALLKGLALDPDSSDAYMASGMVKWLKWDREGAKKDWENAVKEAPGNPNVHSNLSLVLLSLGFFDEAIAEAKQVIQIDPQAGLGEGILSQALLFAQRYDEAIASFQRVLQMNPNDRYSRNMLSLAYALNAMPNDAVAEAKKSIESLSTPEMGLLHLNVALVYAYVGRLDDALKLLDDFLTSRKEMPMDTYTIMEIYSTLSEKDEAFK